MAHEYPDRYNEYKQLRIPKQTEIKWTEEEFDWYYTWFTESTDSSSLWQKYNYMYELFLLLRTDTALTKMLEITLLIRDRDRVPHKDRIIIAETINGARFQQEDRLGLIYLGYDLKKRSVAKMFLELSLYFSSYEEIQRIERCKQAIKLCNDIKLEIRL
jgi:hypothetical protein